MIIISLKTKPIYYSRKVTKTTDFKKQRIFSTRRVIPEIRKNNHYCKNNTFSDEMTCIKMFYFKN